ncbi:MULTISPECIES: MotA/TolQ/ExbB proton channel family protein [unclassified Ekhidna]|jgi:flagellar motor component MotA|uniref:MotA/TolQ/ExbB proton channel family protein n=1 Tax=unclassified Ekhidna TaxID=2632188 RepID=UPI0032DF6D6E
MIELFQMGGMLFMSILTIELAAVIFFATKCFLSKDQSVGQIKNVGLLAVITGILGQLIGLFSAFEAIQQMGAVSPAMLAGGLKVSMITTIYGVIIYIVAILLAIIIKNRK